MHFDQNLLFIVILVVIGIFRAFANIAEKSRQKSERKKAPQPTQPVQRTPPETDAERVRKFLEALGQPQGTPPKKVAPRTHLPPRPVAPIQPPSPMRPFGSPKVENWKEYKRRIVVLQQPELVKPVVYTDEPTGSAEGNEPGEWLVEEAKRRPALAVTKTLIESPPTLESATKRSFAETIWRSALSSPDSLRTAIVLREIFGPPRAFHSLEVGGNA